MRFAISAAAIQNSRSLLISYQSNLIRRQLAHPCSHYPIWIRLMQGMSLQRVSSQTAWKGSTVFFSLPHVERSWLTMSDPEVSLTVESASNGHFLDDQNIVLI